MPLNRLERVKSQYKNVANLLDAMYGYVRQQTANGEPYIIPKLAAAVLNVSEGEAYVLLKMLADGGLLQQQYNVYCGPQGMWLASVDSRSDLDRIPDCDYCDVQHHPEDLTLEIAFRPVPEERADIAA